MSPAQERKILKLNRRGHTIADVSEEMGLSYQDVATFLDTKERTSWQGAKMIITNCLNDLIEESDPAARKELADRADYWVEMIYYDAKRLGSIVDQTISHLGNAGNTLDS